MFCLPRWGLPLASCFVLIGCASLPNDHGRSQVASLVHERGVPTASIESTDAGLDEALAHPLDADTAVRIAVANSPRLRREYARLGLAWAELFEATRLSNPTFGYARRRADDGDIEYTRSLSLELADLLLLPSRTRLGQAEFERERLEIAADILDVTMDVEAGWYRYVGARQVADMRAAVAKAAALSAELAERFHAAGNVSELQLRQEQAAASEARLDAARAAVEATKQRYRLNALMGLSGERAAGWRAGERMPLPVSEEDDAQALLTLAREHRLDLLAARRGADLLTDAESVVRRWRWLGGAEIGYEQERESGGGRLQGPELSLELPLFQQGQGKVARAVALRTRGEEALAQLELDVEAQVLSAIERVRATKEAADLYRGALIPQRETIVAREMERYNFMLVGAFELLHAKREEYDAYEGYLESVRDYWLARVALTRAVGTRLPSDTAIEGLTPSTQEILTPAAPAMDHHDHGSHGASAEDDHAASGHGDMDHGRQHHDGHDQDQDHDHHRGMDHSRHAPASTQGTHEQKDHSRHRSSKPEQKEKDEHNDHAEHHHGVQP